MAFCWRADSGSLYMLTGQQQNKYADVLEDHLSIDKILFRRSTCSEHIFVYSLRHYIVTMHTPLYSVTCNTRYKCQVHCYTIAHTDVNYCTVRNSPSNTKEDYIQQNVQVNIYAHPRFRSSSHSQPDQSLRWAIYGFP